MDGRPRLTVICEYFHPEEASTAQLLTALSVGLTDAFDVNAVTGRPNYHDADRERRVPRRETHRGVEIERVPATRFDKDSLPLRVVNWLSFTLLAAWRLLRGQRDVVLTLSNPPVLPFAAWFEKRLRGTPYVYVVYDMYPDMPAALGVVDEDALVVRAWDRLMRVVYRDADRVVVLGESMADRLAEKMADDAAFDPDHITVISNWEDPGFVEPMPKSENEFAHEHDTVDRFTLVYSGNIGRFHELETAIDAVSLLEDRGRDDVQLLVIGDGARKADLQAYVAREGIDNVRFLPFQPLERVPETLTCGDASLVGIKPEMVGMCVSSKLYSSLAAGMPVLATVGRGDEVQRVVEECDCGAYVEPGDAERAADVLASWADDPGEAARLGSNARYCLEARYTSDHAIAAYRDVLLAVMDGDEPGA